MNLAVYKADSNFLPCCFRQHFCNILCSGSLSGPGLAIDENIGRPGIAHDAAQYPYDMINFGFPVGERFGNI